MHFPEQAYWYVVNKRRTPPCVRHAVDWPLVTSTYCDTVRPKGRPRHRAPGSRQRSDSRNACLACNGIGCFVEVDSNKPHRYCEAIHSRVQCDTNCFAVGFS